MDSIRGGQFQLANTNKLIRFYEGATGLKTGSTDRRATACPPRRSGTHGTHRRHLEGPTSDLRFAGAQALLNYGFSTYAWWT